MVKNMTKTIIIGSYYLEKDEEYISKSYYKGDICVANEQYEKVLLSGFEAANEDYVFISSPRVGTWPSKSKRMIVKGFSENERLKTVSYCSLYGFLNTSKKNAIIKKIKKILKVVPKDTKLHVIACEAHVPYLFAVKYIKENYPNSFSTLIVPDLPVNMTRSNNVIYKILKKLDVKKIDNYCEQYVDSFLCFTNDINKKINPHSKPCIIREGAVIEREFDICKNNNIIRCTFLGKTNEKNGIKKIIEMASYLPNNYVIEIFGSGDMDHILKAVNKPNIIFHGFVPPSKTTSVIENSDIMISPREPVGEYIKYSFPSKIFEYLSFGKRIVTYKLPCYFTEIDEVLDYPEDFTPQSFAKKIVEASNNLNSQHTRYHKIRELLQKYYAINVVLDLIKLREANEK